MDTVQNDRQPVLEATDIWKSFPGVVALAGVSFSASSGVIHALVGENGAGKSTLMRIIAGVYQPDRGCIRLDGQQVSIAGPAQARDLGISMVYQDPRLVPELNVAQNVWLGHEPVSYLGLVDREQLYKRTAAILSRFDIDLDPATPGSMLTVAQRQIVEIAKAIANDAKVLILDEPTSALDPTEVDHLFALLFDLKKCQTSIVFISHRLPEVLQIADWITVLKDGRVVGDMPRSEATEDKLVRMMVGREVDVLYPPRQTTVSDVWALEVQDLVVTGTDSRVTFGVRRGEIVGLAGIEGNGQREILRCLFGLMPREAGQILVAGKPVEPNSPEKAMRVGIVYVTNDRRGEGLALPLSVRENLSLPVLKDISYGGFIQKRRELQVATTLVERLGIRTPSLEQSVSLLSGGNQQKVSLGHWLYARPQVFIFDEPTLGVDVGTKAELYRTIRDLAHQGAGVIVLSADLLELIGLCDRILVVSAGRIVDEQRAEDATEESLIRSAVTASRDDAGGRLKRSDARAINAQRVAWTQRWSGPILVATLLLAFILYTALRSPYFLTSYNLSSLAVQSVPLALAALGQTIVLLLGGVDLSVGPLMSLVTVEASYLIVSNHIDSILLGAIVAVAVGVVVGLINGALIRYLKIPDLIATLATYSAVEGVSLILRPGPGGVVTVSFMNAMTYQVGPIPVAAIVVLMLYILGEVFLLRSRAGTYLYATGSQRDAAFNSGIPINGVRVLGYTFAGVTGALAGLFLAAQIGSGDPQSGTTFTLASITAAVVGGTSIFGGRGTLTGTLLGVLLITGMQNFLDLLQVSSYIQYVWTGVLTLLAVGIYSLQSIGFRKIVHQGLRRPWKVVPAEQETYTPVDT
jgi:ribose transport system ATP-binding protein